MKIYQVRYQAWAGDCGDSDCHDVAETLGLYTARARAVERLEHAANGLEPDYDERTDTRHNDGTLVCVEFGDDYVGAVVEIVEVETDKGNFPFGPEI